MGLTLFDDLVSNHDKKLIAKNLLKHIKSTTGSCPANRKGEGFGKPVMPNLTVNASFSDLVGPDSVFLFKNLGLDVEFLKLPVTKWITDPSYSSNIKILKGFKVVNDLAERGVRLAHDFKNSARNEEHYQNVLKTVDFSRYHVQNTRCKKKKKDMTWLLYTIKEF